MVALPLLGGFTMTKREIRGGPSAQREESDNINTPEVTVTIKTFLEELEQSGRKLKKSSKGHRALPLRKHTRVPHAEG